MLADERLSAEAAGPMEAAGKAAAEEKAPATEEMAERARSLIVALADVAEFN